MLTLRKTVTSGEDLVTADAPLGVLNCRSDGNGGNWAELNGKTLLYGAGAAAGV